MRWGPGGGQVLLRQKRVGAGPGRVRLSGGHHQQPLPLRPRGRGGRGALPVPEPGVQALLFDQGRGVRVLRGGKLL